MVTGYEVKMYRDVERIAQALERIAKAAEQMASPRCARCGHVEAEHADRNGSCLSCTVEDRCPGYTHA